MTKSFRNIAFSALLTLGAFTTITYTSCSKDSSNNNVDLCANVVCQNGGTCSNGSCSCPSGYEGSNCQTQSTTKFLGSWNAPGDKNIASGVVLSPYTCILAQGSSAATIIISTGFYDNFFNHTINATVSGSTITIPVQAPDGTANATVQGSATISTSGQQLTWTYTITDPTAGSKSYTGTWN